MMMIKVSSFINLAKSCLIIGFGFFYSISFAQYNKKYDSLTSTLENATSDSIKFEVLEELAKARFVDTNIRLEYAQKLLNEALAINENLWIYKAHLRIGHIKKQTGDLNSSVESYFYALDQAKILNNKRREALVHSSIASVYRVNQDYNRAFKAYNKSIQLLRESGDRKNLAVSLMNTGELYRTQKVYDTAMSYFKESSILFDSINYGIGKAYNLGNIGLVYAETNETQKAQSYLKQAINILAEEGEYYPIIVYNLSMADIYAEQDKLDAAIKLVEDNLQIAIDNGLKEQIRDANLKLSELYNQKNNLEKAYYHQSQYLVYRDSINNEETIRKMADLRADYEIGQKQAEVDLLEEQQKRQNIIFIGLLVIIVLLVIMVFLYYRNYKRKQALNMIITERKEEAEAQRDQLEAINETKEKFLSIISHDLLGPVNSFKGLSVIMQASIEQKNVDDLKQIHKLFDNSVENLSTLLTNLLDWSVTQQGAIPYNPEEINVAELVNELLHLFSNMALNKDINLSSTVGDKILVWADVNSLKTILRNLTSNAIKFTDQGGQITISAILDDEKVGIQVTDSGVGMAEEKIDELLAKDNFKRSSGTKGEKGVGLGLQLVKEFTEMNKGSMSIESTQEVGTKITVFLPAI